MADEQVRIDIVADDQASKKIDAVATKVDKLEDPVKIPVDADTKPAERDVAALLAKVEGLARDPATILLATNAATIAGDIAGLIGDLDRLDAADPDVAVKVDKINALQGDLDQVEQKLRDINSTAIDPDTRPAKRGLDDVAKSADSSKSVLANMVGNATQDLGVLGGVAGSAGVAIGQMGEYMADSAAAGDKLTDNLRNFGKVAVPVAAIAAVTALAEAFATAAAAEDKLNADNVKRYTDAIRNGASAFGAFKDVVAETQQIMYTADKGGGLFGLFASTKDLTPILANARISVEQFFDIVRRFPEHGNSWISTLENIGVAEGDAIAITRAARQEYENQDKAIDEAGARAVVFGDKTMTQRDAVLAATLAQKDQVDALDAAADAADKAARDTAALESSTMRAEQAARDLDAAWSALTGKLDAEEAIANIGTDFDDMRTKGEEAWKATAKGADDAAQKQDDYAQSVRDAKQDVIDLGRELGLSVPEVKKMLLDIDDGEIDDVERQLQILTRNRTMNLSIITAGGPGYGGTPTQPGPRSLPPAPVEVVNVTQHLPRGWRGDALGEARAVARRSGGLYRRTRR